MGINVNITNALGRVIGLIAAQHPECSIEVEWREGYPEMEWYVTATTGTDSHVYLVDDESGTWMPLNESEIALYNGNRSVLAAGDKYSIVSVGRCAEQTEATMQFEPYEQTNPKAHARGPYALRYAGGRPEGSFPTITEAVAAARPGASVVTADGWWIVGRCAEQTEATR